MSAGIPNVSAELTASRSTSTEFQNFVKEIATSGLLYFRFQSAAKGTRLVWQITDKPFGQPTNGTDWKAPAGLLRNGEQTFVPSSGSFQASFSISFSDFLKAGVIKIKRRVYVRAFVLTSGGLLAARPSNAVIVDYSSPSSNVTVTPPEDPAKKPGVQTLVSVLVYKPPVRWSDPCRFILTKTPPAGELKTILSKIKATTPGTHFSLCKSDYAYIKSHLSADEWVSIALTDFLKALKSGYNWLDDKYNFVENNLVSALANVGVDPQLARKAINYYKAIYGLSPTYGNFDEALDTGKEAISQYVMASGDVPANQKGNVKAKIAEFINQVKAYANGGQDPNQFYRMDPDYAARPAYVLMRVRYEAINGAPADMVGGKSKIAVTVTSGPTVKGYQTTQPITLAQKTVELPDAKAGTVLDIPVYVDYTTQYDEYTWTQGYDSTNQGEIRAGNGGLKWVVNKKYPQ